MVLVDREARFGGVGDAGRQSLEKHFSCLYARLGEKFQEDWLQHYS